MVVDIHHNILHKFSSGLTLLSSDPSVVPLTDGEIKKAFYLGSPVTWRTAFKQANPLILDPASHFDITSLLQAMRGNQQILQEKICNHQCSPRPRDDHTNTRNICSRHLLRGGFCGSGHPSNLSGRGTPGHSLGGTHLASTSGNCPYRTTIPSHAHHNWLDCLYNPQSGNFDQTKFNSLQTRSQANPSTTATPAAPSRSAHATSHHCKWTSNIPSTWGTRCSTHTHANDVVSVWTTATSNNHANKANSGLSEPLPAVLEQAQQARDCSPVSTQDWTLLWNADRTIPGESLLSCSNPLPFVGPHHLDALFAQQCQVQTGPHLATLVSKSIPMPLSRKSANNCFVSMDAAWTLPTSMIFHQPEESAPTNNFPCLKNFFNDVVNPDKSYLNTLESYNEFYSPSSWPTAFASSLPQSLLSVAESSLATVLLTLLLSRQIGGATNDVPFCALLDSGADKTIIHSCCLLPGMHPRVTNQAVNTTMGTQPNVSEIDLHDIILPEFSCWADIFDAPHSHYNIIVGSDLLSCLGVILDFQHGISMWENVDITMRDCNLFESDSNLTSHFVDLYGDDPVIGDNVLHESYFQTDFQALATRQTYLSAEQRQDLLLIWQQCPDLFSGQLGLYPDQVLHLHMKDDAVPVHHCAYLVPCNLSEAFKKELDRFVDFGILASVGATEWAAPHFPIPRKDGCVQFILDFCSLNAQSH